MANQPDHRQLGKRLKELRVASGFATQAKLLEALQGKGVEVWNVSSVARWETGRNLPRRQTLLVILQLFKEEGGLKDPEEAEEVYRLGGYGNLRPAEVKALGWVWSGGEDGEAQEREVLTVQRRVFNAPEPPVQGIVGRKPDLEKLQSLLSARGMEWEPAPVLITGMAGVGKTTLAIALARSPQMARLCPDGVLWTSVGPSPAVRLKLEEWGDLLGTDLRSAADEDACRGRLRNA